MATHIPLNRRDFMRLSGAGAAAAGLGLRPGNAASRPVPPSDRITIGFVGVGARAHQLIETVKNIEGTEVVAVCDAYQGRIDRAITRTDGRAEAVADYRAIVERDDIDTVFIVTPDHWHVAQAVAALDAGKPIYIEKPLTYTADEGRAIVEAQERSGVPVQVGSPGVNSVLAQKAREMIAAGDLGQVTMVRATTNRNTASGAWIYPIPPDASPETVDWKMFLGPAPDHPFDLERFFRWRCYRDYSGGVATDLFVHTCTTINYIMSAGMCESAVANAGLFRWTESRDTPDTINASLMYPEGFLVNLSGTLNNRGGGGSGIQVLGTEGTLILGRDLTFIPEHVNESNGWIVDSWPEDLERAYYADPAVVAEERPGTRPQKVLDERIVYTDEGLNSGYVHVKEFFDAVRNGTPTKEDARVGHYAASCAHMINASVEQGRAVHWDHERETIAQG